MGGRDGVVELLQKHRERESLELWLESDLMFDEGEGGQRQEWPSVFVEA